MVHLDKEFWRPGWKEPDKEEWAEQVRELVARDEWISDGNFGATHDIRLPAADTIILLEASTLRCTWRVLRRWWEFRGRNRPDLPEGCPEEIDVKFLFYIWGFRWTRRKALLARVESLRKGRRVEILAGNSEIRRFLESV